jgi:hypothetical protein
MNKPTQFRLVPVEPTPEMLEAVFRAMPEARGIWSAMLAAAPRPYHVTAERLPTRDDADYLESVLAYHVGLGWIPDDWAEINPDICPFWMPMPPDPEPRAPTLSNTQATHEGMSGPGIDGMGEALMSGGAE